MKWPKGHVECVIIAKNNAIKQKKQAIREVIYYIHQAGLDIEHARKVGGKAIDRITTLIRKHIPEHKKEAIIESLRLDLNVINYRNLNIDKEGMKEIRDLALEAGILKKSVNIDLLSDDSFSTKITESK